MALFVNFGSTFDSVELNAVLQVLAKDGTDGNYVEVVEEYGLLDRCNAVHLPGRLPVGRGLMEHDPLSPKLFTPFSEVLFRKKNWKGGVSVIGLMEEEAHIGTPNDLFMSVLRLELRERIRCNFCVSVSNLSYFFISLQVSLETVRIFLNVKEC